MNTRPASPSDAPRPEAVAQAGHPGNTAATLSTTWRIVAGFEVVLAGVTVAFDLWVPTLILLALAAVSLLIRRQGPRTLGLEKPDAGRWWPLEILGFAVAWTLVTIGLTIPVLEHLSGQRQDVSQFAAVQGNLGLLALLLAFSWTLGAIGEEVAYRGFLLTRLQEAIGGRQAGPAAIVIAAIATALLFGWAHNEQGMIGIVTTCLDALFFTWLRFRYRSLWAAVLAHGFNNTIGLVAYFLVGPIYGLW
ncbi:MAG TPA: CPBP family intramembrane glutamic endopeptidase [Propionicimonas sp.]|nr:CPBP family intramembrane glutamic endopeptidase [Propionicimonas sp.]